MTSRSIVLTPGPDIAVANSAVANSATAAASYFDGTLRYAVRRGADRNALLRAIGVDASALQDPHARLPLSVFIALLRASAAVLDDAAFALHFGADVPCSELTLASPLAAMPPAAATSTTPMTVRDALVGLNRYAPLGVDFGGTGSDERFVFVQGIGALGTGVVRLVDQRPLDLWPELTESVWARMVTGMVRRFGARAFRGITMTHDAPSPDETARREAYARYFPLPVTFGASENALVLDASVLSEPIEPLARTVSAVLAPHADAQLAALARGRTWRGRVEALLRERLADGHVDIGVACDALAVSRQTLYRRLRDEGTTFADVHDALRRAEADALLARGDLSVAVIAARLGYSEVSAFSRAYTRWTGQRPSGLRRAVSVA